MNIDKLKRQAQDLLVKNGDKIDRGITSAENFAGKRAKGREAQVHKVADTVRQAVNKQRPPA